MTILSQFCIKCSNEIEVESHLQEGMVCEECGYKQPSIFFWNNDIIDDFILSDIRRIGSMLAIDKEADYRLSLFIRLDPSWYYESMGDSFATGFTKSNGSLRRTRIEALHRLAKKWLVASKWNSEKFIDTKVMEYHIP